MPFKRVFFGLLASMSMSLWAADAPLGVTPETMTFDVRPEEIHDG